MRVLIVDDEALLLEAGRQFFEREEGFSVSSATSASAALALLAGVPFDAIVSGNRMPDMDGIALLKQVRLRYGGIPFILCTRDGQESVMIEAFSEGADSCFPKDGDPPALFAGLAHTIRKAVSWRRSGPDLLMAGGAADGNPEYDRIISGFSRFLLNATSADQVLDHLGDVVSGISGADYVMLAKLFPEERAVGVHSLRNFGPLLGRIGSIVNAAPESIRVPVDTIMARQDGFLPGTGLRKLDGGIFELARGHLPQPACTEIENLLRVQEIWVCEMVREGSLYGSITLGFCPGHALRNPSLVTTLCSLVANALRRIYSADAIALEKKLLMQSEENYRGLFNSIPFGLCILDREGKVIDVNTGAEQLYGYTRPELLGRTAAFLSAPGKNDFDAVAERIRQAIAGEPQQCGFWGRKKNGVIFSEELFLTRGTYSGADVVIAVCVDITGRKLIEDSLRIANRKLNLLTGITRHDIKNQILVLDSFIALLRQDTDNPALDHYFSRITAASSQIAAMIRFTKEYDQLGLNDPVWQDVRRMARMAAVDLLPEHVRLDVDTEPCEIFADPMLLLVLYNLFENALRHGGSVTVISVRFGHDGTTGTLTIRDNGIGIPESLKEQIFERGFGKNTGLGLFLIREILSITGLTIRETGTEGNGACFEITLPPGTWRRVNE